MALLCCWQDGQSLKTIAESWDVGVGTVRCTALTIRHLLGVDDLDTAVDLVQDRLAKYRGTLPLSGRCKQRPPADGSPLSEPLLAVLRLTADGQGCLAIAALLGKDKSTISRQMRQVNCRLGVESRQDAVRKAQAMGLLPQGLPVSHRERLVVAFRSGRQRFRVLFRDQASGEPTIPGWASRVHDAAGARPSRRPPRRTRTSARRGDREPA
jgi:DNA-binding CsgD family transcriptional regulator